MATFKCLCYWYYWLININYFECLPVVVNGERNKKMCILIKLILIKRDIYRGQGLLPVNQFKIHISQLPSFWNSHSLNHYLLPFYPPARHQATRNNLYIPEHTEIYSKEANHKSGYPVFPCFSCGSHNKGSCHAFYLHLLPLDLSWCFLMWSRMLWYSPSSKKLIVTNSLFSSSSLMLASPYLNNSKL